MVYLKEYSNSNLFYRGYTTNTNLSDFVWVTSNKNHAKKYADINKYTYGGERKLDKFILSDNDYDYNLLNLYEYDMNELVNENGISDFLLDVNIDYEDFDLLFDFSEDKIPLSRVVNKILNKLTINYDGFKIMEGDNKTIYIKRDLLE